MKLLKIKIHENCQIIAVADDSEMILTVGAFTSEDDAETASDVLFTLLANLGLIKAGTSFEPQPLSKLINTFKETVAIYKKELTE